MKKQHLLIVEEDLGARFLDLEKKITGDKIVMRLKNITGQSLLETLMSRIKKRRMVRTEYESIVHGIGEHDVILISNTEGFIACNICSWLKEDFPEVVLITLQHGMFELDRKYSFVLKKVINYLSKMVFNFQYIGLGYINKVVDAYIVYNNNYKSELVSMGVPRNKIFVSAGILKGHSFMKKVERKNGNRGQCVFMLQPLAALGVTDETTEFLLLGRVIDHLSAQHSCVLIKQHPYQDVLLPPLADNCYLTDDNIVVLAETADIAVSFYSEALNEFAFHNVPTMAVKSDRFKVNEVAYSSFTNVVSFDKGPDIELLYSKNISEAIYETEIENVDQLLADLERD